MKNFWEDDPIVGGTAVATAPAVPAVSGGNFWEADPVVAPAPAPAAPAAVAPPVAPPPQFDIDKIQGSPALKSVMRALDPEKFDQAQSLYDKAGQTRKRRANYDNRGEKLLPLQPTYAIFNPSDEEVQQAEVQRAEAAKIYGELMPHGRRWISDADAMQAGIIDPATAWDMMRSQPKDQPDKLRTTGKWYELSPDGESLILAKEDRAARDTFAKAQLEGDAGNNVVGRTTRRFVEGVNAVTGEVAVRPFSAGVADELQRNRASDVAAIEGVAGPIESTAGNIAQSTGTLVGTAALATASGGTATPGVIAGGFGVARAGEALTEAKDAGLSREKQLEHMVVQGGIEGGTSLVFSKLLKMPGLEGAFNRSAIDGATTKQITAQVSKRLLKSGIEEVPEELATQVLSNLASRLTIDPNRPALTKDELIDVTVQAFLAGSVTNTPAAVLDGTAAWARQRPGAASRVAALDGDTIGRKELTRAGIDAETQGNLSTAEMRQEIVAGVNGELASRPAPYTATDTDIKAERDAHIKMFDDEAIAGIDEASRMDARSKRDEYSAGKHDDELKNFIEWGGALVDEGLQKSRDAAIRNGAGKQSPADVQAVTTKADKSFQFPTPVTKWSPIQPGDMVAYNGKPATVVSRSENGNKFELFDGTNRYSKIDRRELNGWHKVREQPDTGPATIPDSAPNDLPPVELGEDWRQVTPSMKLPENAQTYTDPKTGAVYARQGEPVAAPQPKDAVPQPNAEVPRAPTPQAPVTPQVPPVDQAAVAPPEEVEPNPAKRAAKLVASKPLPPLNPAVEVGVRKRYREAFGQELGPFVEPEAVHAEAKSFLDERKIKHRWFRPEPGAYGHSAYDPETKTIYLNAAEKDNVLWYIVGHEYAHATGADRRLADLPTEIIDKAKIDYASGANPKYLAKLQKNDALWTREAVARYMGEILADPTKRAELRRSAPTVLQKIIEAVKSLFTGKKMPESVRRVLAEFGNVPETKAETPQEVKPTPAETPAAAPTASPAAESTAPTTPKAPNGDATRYDRYEGFANSLEGTAGGEMGQAVTKGMGENPHPKITNDDLAADAEAKFAADPKAARAEVEKALASDGALTDELFVLTNVVLGNLSQRVLSYGSAQDLADFGRLKRLETLKRSKAGSALQSLQIRLMQTPAGRRQLVAQELTALSEREQKSLDAAMADLKKFGGSEMMLSDRGMMLSDAPQTGAFKKWFGDSKVVDENGKPLRVYHGTPHSGFSEFESGRPVSTTDSGWLGTGHYFTTNPSTASFYASNRASTSAGVMPVYLSVKNPFKWGKKNKGVRGESFGDASIPKEIRSAVLKRAGFTLGEEPDFSQEAKLSKAIQDELIARGYDGIIADLSGNKSLGDADSQEIVAFDSKQIKSATGNRGTFDPNENDIRLADKPSPINKVLAEKTPEDKSRIKASMRDNNAARAAAAVLRIQKQIAERQAKFKERMEKKGVLPNSPAGITAMEADHDLAFRTIRELRAWNNLARGKSLPFTGGTVGVKGLADALFELSQANILSGFKTITLNVAGTPANYMLHLLPRGIAAAGNKAASAVSGGRLGKEGPQLGEFKHMLTGLPGVLKQALRNAFQSAVQETSMLDRQSGLQGSTLEALGGDYAIPGFVGRMVRLPGYGSNRFGDDLTRTVIAHVEARARAYRDAIENDVKDVEGHIKKLYGDADSVAWKDAFEEANKMAFQEKGGETRQNIKNALSSTRKKIPGVRWFMRFVNFPVNAAVQTTEWTPIHFWSVLSRASDNMDAGRPPLHGVKTDVAKAFLGTLAIYMMMDDLEDEEEEGDFGISGASHPNEARRNTVRFGDTRINYSRFDPFGSALSLLADTGLGIKKHGFGGKATLASMASIGDTIVNKPVMQGIRDMVDLGADFQRSRKENDPAILEDAAKKLAASQTLSFMPRIVSQFAEATGDEPGYDKRNRTMAELFDIEHVRAAAQYDAWGNKNSLDAFGNPYGDYAWRLMTPINIEVKDQHPGDKLIGKWNSSLPEGEKAFRIPQMPPRWTLKGKPTNMTPEQFQRYAELSGKVAAKLYAAGNFDPEHPTKEQVEALERNFAAARETAKDLLKREIETGKPETTTPDELAKSVAKARVKTIAETLKSKYSPKKSAKETLPQFKERVEKERKRRAEMVQELTRIRSARTPS